MSLKVCIKTLPLCQRAGTTSSSNSDLEDTMGNRLSKIYTRTGDDGTTGLGNGNRVEKDCNRVEAYGTVDELNSALGMILAYKDVSEPIKNCLTRVQNELFDLGSELCIPDYVALRDDHVTQLEIELDQFNSHLRPLKEFILPGGHPASAACHLARAICRRAERRTVTLAHKESVTPPAIQYLNRLSDLLFVIARLINHENGITEPMWNHERKKK